MQFERVQEAGLAYPLFCLGPDAVHHGDLPSPFRRS